MPINIAFAADTRTFLKGAGDVETALERTGDALDDLARDGDKAGDKLEQTFREISRKAKDNSDDVGKTYEKNFRQAEDAADRFRRGADDGMRDLNQNAGANAKEFAASWDGSAEGALDSIQGFAAEALEGFGPLGLAGGAALAAAAGAMYAAFQQNAELSEQRISDMYEDMVESGQSFVSEQFLTDELQKIYGKADDAAVKWADLLATVEATGLSQATVARAYAGDTEAGAQLTEALNDKLREQADFARDAAEKGQRLNDAYYDANVALQDVAGSWRDNQAETDNALERVEGYREAVAGLPTNHVLDMEVNTQPGRIGMGDFVREAESRRVAVPVVPDFTEFDRQVANKRPVIEGVFRAGKAAV